MQYFKKFEAVLIKPNSIYYFSHFYLSSWYRAIMSTIQKDALYRRPDGAFDPSNDSIEYEGKCQALGSGVEPSINAFVEIDVANTIQTLK